MRCGLVDDVDRTIASRGESERERLIRWEGNEGSGRGMTDQGTLIAVMGNGRTIMNDWMSENGSASRVVRLMDSYAEHKYGKA